MGCNRGVNNSCYDATYYKVRANRYNAYNNCYNYPYYGGCYGYPNYGCGDGGYGCGYDCD